MEFRILGSVEVADDGVTKDLGGLRERTLLARLLLSAGQVVSADRLAEDLWAGRPPPQCLATLRVYISRLRRALGPASAALLTQPPGYRMVISPGQLDASRFAGLVAAGRQELAAGRPGRRPPSSARPSGCGAARRCPMWPTSHSPRPRWPGWLRRGWPPSKTWWRPIWPAVTTPL